METESVPVQTQAPVSKSRFNLNTILFVSIFLIVLVLMTLIGIIMLKKYQEGRVDNGVKEGEKIAKDSLVSIFDSIDFSELDEDEPLAFIDFDSLFAMSDDYSDAKYLKSAESIIPGNTSHYAFDVDLNLSAGSRINMSIDSDIYQSFSDDFDIEAYQDLVSEISENSNDNSKIAEIYGSDEFKDLLNETSSEMNGDINYEIEGDSVSFDFKFTQVGENGYLLMDNLVNDGDLLSDDDLEILEDIEGKTVRVSLESLLSYIENNMEDNNSESFELNSQNEDLLNFISDLQKVQEGEMDIEDSEYYQNLNESLSESLEDSDSEDIELLQRLGNPIKDELKEYLTETKFFSNFKSVEVARDVKDLKCVEGTLDNDAIIRETEELFINLVDIIGNDESSNTSKENIEEQKQLISEQFQGLELFKDSIVLSVSECHEEASNLNRGAGMNLRTTIPGAKYNLKFNYLLVSPDSSFEIETPEFDEELSDEVEEYLESN